MTTERDELQWILQDAVTASPADETQIDLRGGRLHVVRFADNRIQASVEERWARAKARVAFWGRGHDYQVGEAWSRNVSPKGLRSLLLFAGDEARARRAEPAYVRMPFPDDFESVLGDLSATWDERTATAGVALAADTVSRVTLPAMRAGLRAEGFLGLGVGTLALDDEPGIAALANSNGVFHYYKPTRLTLRARILHPHGGYGRVDVEAYNLATLGLEPLVEEAVTRAHLRFRPGGVSPGPVRVLLEAPAVATLLECLRPHFSYSHVLVDTSPFAARFETPVFDPAVTLSLSPMHPLLLARPFDEEGWPRRELTLVEAGVLRLLLRSRTQARSLGLMPMGYTEFVDGEPVVAPRHLALAGGEHDREALLHALDEGLLVGRLASAELIPPNTFRITAMTGNDNYLVRGGRLAANVGALRLTGQLDTLLGSGVVIGHQARAWPSVTAPIVAEGFEIA